MASGADTAAVYANITAATISLSEDVLNDAGNIATASASGEAGNNENINELISICQDAGMFNGGTPEDFMNSIIATLGSESSYAQRLSGSKSSILKNIDDRRISVSGVSSDEETANLTKYEQAYNASATMVSIWNNIYEETINLVSD
jgi:flagellar hook-associated protein 1 FlgK